MPKKRFILFFAFIITTVLQLTAQTVQSPLSYKKENASESLQLKAFSDHSVLSQGEWTRWAVSKTGVQKITFTQLQSAGMSLPVAAQNIRVFGNGGRMLPEDNGLARQDDLSEVACVVEDNGDGLFNSANDYILFFAEGPVTWSYDTSMHSYSHSINLYSDYSCYFVNISDATGKRISEQQIITDVAAVQLDNFQDLQWHELELVNLLHSGKIWLGEVFNNQLSYTFNFDLPDLELSDSVLINTYVSSRAFDSSRFQCTAWGQSFTRFMDIVNPNVNTDYCKSTIFKMEVLPSSENCALEVTYLPPDQNSTGWLNYIELVARRKMVYHGEQLLFRNADAITTSVAQFNLSGLEPSFNLWNVTDGSNVKQVPVVLSGTDGYFKQSTDTLQEYVLFEEDDCFSPAFIETVVNQDLHATAFPDMVIVTYSDFLGQASRLADFHRNTDSMEVLVCLPQQIYNEFSSGMQDPAAIRDFMRMLHQRAGSDSLKNPKYLLLFGDGSYDPKNRVPANTNLIPTYQTWNSVLPTSSYVSDDFFGLLDAGEGPDATGLIDLGVGRLPASTIAEAEVLVDKILRYNSPVDLLPASSLPSPDQISNFADWRNVITFVADDEDGNLHFSQAEILTGIVDSLTDNININKIYLDAFQQDQTALGPRYPGAHQALNDQVKRGSLIINYTGHGGETGLADERILEISDIDSWTNYFNLPVFITATCEFSRYDNPAEKSAGEHMLMSAQGGAIALLSTTRVAYAHTNMIINTNLLKAAFDEEEGQRLGDIVRKAKVRCGTGVYMQNFTLLGDPAVRLVIPQYHVVANGLNGDTLQSGDTIVAGTSIGLQGYVADYSEQLMAGFEGEVICTVFDKKQSISTLGNDASSAAEEFYAQQSVLFKGRAVVHAGKFSFDFTLPKDVTFNEGNARISFYAKSLNSDATGCETDIVVESNSNCGIGDNSGPAIKLFINDRGFMNNGITAADIKFIADLEDPDGINFFSAGIGHDIIMVLDQDFNNPVVLNDYYSPALGNSRKGTAEYKITDLAEGTHTLWLRAWDVLNFSSESELSFIVKENNDLSLNHVEVYPNPMTNSINFCFDRNKTQGEQWLQISVKSIDGKVLWSSERKILAQEPIHLCNVWDGNDVNGKALPAGLYIYVLKIMDTNGEYKQFTGKISKSESH